MDIKKGKVLGQVMKCKSNQSDALTNVDQLGVGQNLVYLIIVVDQYVAA